MTNLTIYGQMDADLEKTVKILRERNVGIVIRDPATFNQGLLSQVKDKAKCSGKGKEKVSSLSHGKGKENEWWKNVAWEWQDAARNFELINARPNKVFVHSSHWTKYIEIDTYTFYKVMMKIHKLPK